MYAVASTPPALSLEVDVDRVRQLIALVAAVVTIPVCSPVMLICLSVMVRSASDRVPLQSAQNERSIVCTFHVTGSCRKGQVEV